MNKLFLVLSLGLMVFTCGPKSFAAADQQWGFCKDSQAFEDKEFKKRKPKADWVCKLPTALETGESQAENSLRCKRAENLECRTGNPDLAYMGDQNVPSHAWYVIPGARQDHPYVRCRCGCFPGDVRILTTQGYQFIRDLAERAKTHGLRVAIADQQSKELKASQTLFGPDFTVGPEQKPIYRVVAANGAAVDLTDEHPVLVVSDGKKSMIQAKKVEIGDLLLTEDGQTVEVVDVTTYYLPAGNDLVYNLDTKDANESGHVILANGLQMGDLYWQTKLSERSSRIQNLLN